MRKRVKHQNIHHHPIIVVIVAVEITLHYAVVRRSDTRTRRPRKNTIARSGTTGIGGANDTSTHLHYLLLFLLHHRTWIRWHIKSWMINNFLTTCNEGVMIVRRGRWRDNGGYCDKCSLGCLKCSSQSAYLEKPRITVF
jgi:hypothetical protein